MRDGDAQAIGRTGFGCLLLVTGPLLILIGMMSDNAELGVVGIGVLIASAVVATLLNLFWPG